MERAILSLCLAGLILTMVLLFLILNDCIFSLAANIYNLEIFVFWLFYISVVFFCNKKTELRKLILSTHILRDDDDVIWKYLH